MTEADFDLSQGQDQEKRRDYAYFFKHTEGVFHW